MYFSAHNHSEYSNIRLLDSINKVGHLFNRALELNLKGFAITDHEVLSSHVQLIQKYNQLKKANKLPTDFKVVLGDEIYLIDDIADYKLNYSKDTHQYYHFILLAKDAIGYEGLKEISSFAWSNSYTQRGVERVPTEKQQLAKIMERYKGHIIASTACMGGELPRLIIKLAENEKNEIITYNTKKRIDSFINYCIDTFGQEDFYFELQPSLNKDQIAVNKKLIQLGDIYNVKLIYTTDSHYVSKEKRIIHKSYLNAMEGEREVDDFYATAYMMSIEEVYNYFEEYIDKELFDIWTQNTIDLSDKCEVYDLYKPQLIPTIEVEDRYSNNFRLYFDDYKYPYIYKMLTSDSIHDRYWAGECLTALENKQLNNEKYWSRLESEAKELWLISEKLDITMTQYYNTMKKIIELIWDKGDSLIGPARGSATGFLSCYLLEITQIDPLLWNLPYWRHLTSTRPELPDIDFDTEAGKRKNILNSMREFFNINVPEFFNKFSNYWNVLNIATFGTEGPKSACLTACRGYRSEEFPNGIDNDIAQYLTSMIPSERGFTWSLADCVLGNEEKNRKPIHAFINEVNKYEGLLDIMMSIEGIVNKRSIHASGVYIYNEGFLKYNAVMKAPNGSEITQFNMNDSDYMGSLKYDFLTVEALDKIRVCLDLLLEDGLIEYQDNLKTTYSKFLHPDILEYNNSDIWDLLENGEVINLFQFDTPVGAQCVKKVKPRSLPDLASANSLMRLMAEQGTEQPADRYVRLKNNMNAWYNELKLRNLTQDEVKILEPHYLPVYGTPNTQEDMMEILMNPQITNFDLIYANKARKIIAKKKMNEVTGFQETFYKKGDENGTSLHMLLYVWDTAIKPQLGYSFSRNHTTPYSTIALQELTLYNKYPPIFWDTACLTVNSGSIEQKIEETKKSTNYGKMAVAIGDMKSAGVDLRLADINKSSFGFKPDLENNQILFGLKGITNVGDEVVNDIIKNRPYTSIEDLQSKVKIKKPALLNLIKGGAFDKLYKDLTREQILEMFIHSIAEEKKKLNLQNFNGLIEVGLIPEELEFTKRVFEYNKVLKKYFKDGEDFTLDNEQVLNFYNEHFDTNLLEVKNNNYVINQKLFDKMIYQKEMDKARAWIKSNHDNLLEEFNRILFQRTWDKYCKGNISSWEMQSVSFYYHEHELNHVNKAAYGIRDFNSLPEIPEVDYFFKKNNKDIPIYKLTRVIGTVIGKNKTNGSISLLTTNEVVTVRFRKEMFALYDKQLSEVLEDGSKKIIEKSWFTKGNKIMIVGYRREDQFVPKKYANTGGHTIYLIDDIYEDGSLKLRGKD